MSLLTENIRYNPWQLSVAEQQRVHIGIGAGVIDCQSNIQIGMFFDGTRNNKKYDEPKSAHSNVARLYEAFDELPRQGEERQYRFKNYAAGVGTEFWKELGDTGTGIHAAAGAAAGWGGEARINWALLQLQNNLWFHVFGRNLSDDEETNRLVRRMSTDIRLANLQWQGDPPAPFSAEDVASRKALSTTRTLDALFSTQWRDTDTEARRTVLAERRERLRKDVMPVLTQQLPHITEIRISVFGFSRGAAEARVFVNWLRDLCDEAHGPMRICGVPAMVDFLGIFDTVASVGAAQGVLEDVADGHGGWARPRDLRIPDASIVKQCLHFVSGHEARGSFPVDAAAGENVEEIVFPGVHSDIGGGYLPGEQGRGLTDDAKLSQIPLCEMYRAARVAGVPLVDIDVARQAVKDAFKVSPDLIDRFNAYMAEVRRSSFGTTTTDLVRTHYRAYLHWRRHRLGRHANLPGTQRASRQDRTDLLQADAELKQEWELLQHADAYASARNGLWGRGYTGLAWRSIEGLTSAAVLFFVNAMGSMFGSLAHDRFRDLPGGVVSQIVPQYDGYQAMRLTMAFEHAAESKWGQWREVNSRSAWGSEEPAPQAICALLEQDVHDSRAWFKPLGDDDDVWIVKQRAAYAEQQRDMEALLRKEATAREGQRPKSGLALPMFWPLAARTASPAASGLNAAEKDRLAAHRTRARTLGMTDEQFLRTPPKDEWLPTQPSGREFSAFWGYLRWRTVYVDPYMDYRSEYPALAHADRTTLNRRRRELERQARADRSRVEALHQAASARVDTNALFNGAQGVGPMAYYDEIQAAEVELRKVEREIAAVSSFLDELGPESWW